MKPKKMVDFAEKMHPETLAPTIKINKYYPSITVDAKDVSVGDSKVGSMATLHAHVRVKRIEDAEDGKRITLEIQRGDAKPGITKVFAKNIKSRIKEGK